MTPLLRARWFALLTIAALSLGFDCKPDGNCNWLTIKNDTTKAIIVQEVVVVNGQTKRGKPTNLLAGDTVREKLPMPTVKQIEVFDAQNPKQPIWTGKLDCKDDAQTFSVTITNGKVDVTKVPNSPAPKK
jgi:hypothetical protein